MILLTVIMHFFSFPHLGLDLFLMSQQATIGSDFVMFVHFIFLMILFQFIF